MRKIDIVFFLTCLSLTSCANSTDEVFVQVLYENGESPEPGFFFQYYSPACFQMNTTANLTIETGSSTSLYRLVSRENATSEDSVCKLGSKQITVKFQVTGELLEGEDLLGDDTLDWSLWVQQKGGIGSILTFAISEINVTIETLGTFRHVDISGRTKPLVSRAEIGYSHGCAYFLHPYIRFQSTEPGRPNLTLWIGETTVQAFRFTRGLNHYNTRTTCRNDYLIRYQVFPCSLYIGSVLVPILIMGWAVRSVTVERRAREFQMHRDLYSMSTGCLLALRQFFRYFNTKVFRVRLNSI